MSFVKYFFEFLIRFDFLNSACINMNTIEKETKSNESINNDENPFDEIESFLSEYSLKVEVFHTTTPLLLNYENIRTCCDFNRNPKNAQETSSKNVDEEQNGSNENKRECEASLSSYNSALLCKKDEEFAKPKNTKPFYIIEDMLLSSSSISEADKNAYSSDSRGLSIKENSMVWNMSPDSNISGNFENKIMNREMVSTNFYILGEDTLDSILPDATDIEISNNTALDSFLVPTNYTFDDIFLNNSSSNLDSLESLVSCEQKSSENTFLETKNQEVESKKNVELPKFAYKKNDNRFHPYKVMKGSLRNDVISQAVVNQQINTERVEVNLSYENESQHCLYDTKFSCFINKNIDNLSIAPKDSSEFIKFGFNAYLKTLGKKNMTLQDYKFFDFKRMEFTAYIQKALNSNKSFSLSQMKVFTNNCEEIHGFLSTNKLHIDYLYYIFEESHKISELFVHIHFFDEIFLNDSLKFFKNWIQHNFYQILSKNLTNFATYPFNVENFLNPNEFNHTKANSIYMYFKRFYFHRNFILKKYTILKNSSEIKEDKKTIFGFKPNFHIIHSLIFEIKGKFFFKENISRNLEILENNTTRFLSTNIPSKIKNFLKDDELTAIETLNIIFETILTNWKNFFVKILEIHLIKKRKKQDIDIIVIIACHFIRYSTALIVELVDLYVHPNFNPRAIENIHKMILLKKTNLSDQMNSLLTCNQIKIRSFNFAYDIQNLLIEIFELNQTQHETIKPMIQYLLPNSYLGFIHNYMVAETILLIHDYIISNTSDFEVSPLILTKSILKLLVNPPNTKVPVWIKNFYKIEYLDDEKSIKDFSENESILLQI